MTLILILSSSGATPFLLTREPEKVISGTTKMYFFAENEAMVFEAIKDQHQMPNMFLHILRKKQDIINVAKKQIVVRAKIHS